MPCPRAREGWTPVPSPWNSHQAACGHTLGLSPGSHACPGSRTCGSAVHPGRLFWGEETSQLPSIEGLQPAFRASGELCRMQSSPGPALCPLPPAFVSARWGIHSISALRTCRQTGRRQLRNSPWGTFPGLHPAVCSRVTPKQHSTSSPCQPLAFLPLDTGFASSFKSRLHFKKKEQQVFRMCAPESSSHHLSGALGC